ncbi:DUF47 family protein [Candidatus Margulisiibacteriota bacterium]
MALMEKFFGQSPFKLLIEHTRKVHECVELMRPIAEALIAEDNKKLEELHNLMSKTEHEADIIKNRLRDDLSHVYLLSVGRYELTQFLAYQDGLADSAEDFAVVTVLRKTKILPELKEDFLAFVDQVITVSDHFLDLAEELSLLAEATFTGAEADRVLKAVDVISEEEWQADKLQRKFARHYYSVENKLDPMTLFFYDKYCHTLSAVANDAEKTAKYLRQIILKK